MSSEPTVESVLDINLRTRHVKPLSSWGKLYLRIPDELRPASIVDFSCGHADFLARLPVEMRRVGPDGNPGYADEYRAAGIEFHASDFDADEFVAGDPKPLLEAAARSGAHIVPAWHMNFYPTPSDIARIRELGAEKWEKTPLFDRLRWYQADWKELRFLRVTDDFVWEQRDGRSKMTLRGGRKPRVYRRSAVIRHYCYRSPSQVERRYGTRRAIRAEGYDGFRYDQTARLEGYVCPESSCKRWPDDRETPEISAREVFRFERRRLQTKLEKALFSSRRRD